MPYNRKNLELLKRILPLSGRRLSKKLVLSGSLMTGKPLWTFFDSPREFLETEKNYSAPRVPLPGQKHIAVLLPWVERGGSLEMLMRIIKGLAGKGFYFSVWCTRTRGIDAHRLESYADIRGLKLGWKTEDNNAMAIKLTSFGKPDAILLMDMDPDSFFFLTYIKALNIPIIDWVHFHTDVLPPYRRLMAKMGHYIDHFVVVNKEMEHALASPAFNIASNRISSIPNGIHAEEFNPEIYTAEDRKIFREKFGISKDRPVISFISRFDEVKNPGGAVEIFEKIHESFPDAYFIMAGDGHLFAKIKKQVESKKIGPRTMFPGFIDDIRPVLAISSILIAPSFSESFGLAVGEAMAFEIPVIVSDVGGLRGLVRNGIDGYRLYPDDKLGFAEKAIELLQNPKKSAQFGQNGRNRMLKDFPIENTIGQFNYLFNDIVKK